MLFETLGRTIQFIIRVSNPILADFILGLSKLALSGRSNRLADEIF